jgi:hypothetical protein
MSSKGNKDDVASSDSIYGTKQDEINHSKIQEARPSSRDGSNATTKCLPMRHSKITTNTHPRIGGLLTSSDISSSMDKSFPSPFKCAGDFCNFVIQEASSLGNDQQHKSNKRSNIRTYEASNAVGLLFPKEELHALGDSNVKTLLRNMIVTKKDPIGGLSETISTNQGLRLITYKSIALGKKNKKHLDTAQTAQQEIIGEETITNEPNRNTRPKRKTFMDNTLSKEIQATYAKKMGELEGGTANYYRQVCVCQNCYAVYRLLDEGRKMMEEEKNVHQMLQENQIKRKLLIKEQWNTIVEENVEEKKKNLYAA